MCFKYEEKKIKHFLSKKCVPGKWNPLVWIFLLTFFSLISGYKAGAKPLSAPQVRGGDEKILYNGVLRDSDGNGLIGVTVNLISNNTGIRYSTITSETGAFRFFNLPPGTYTLEYESEGFKAGKEEVEIKIGIHENPHILYVPTMGGIDGPPIEDPKKESSPELSNSNHGDIPLKIQKTVISENLGLNRIIQEIAQKNKIEGFSFYYSKGSIFAKNGIAKVGIIEKQLNKITTIPYKDDDYIKNGLKLEEKGVYCIRLGEKDEGKIILRVLKINSDNIEVEYHIVSK